MRTFGSGWRRTWSRSDERRGGDLRLPCRERGPRGGRWSSPSTAPAAPRTSSCRSCASSSPAPPSSRRGATSPSTGRCASSAAPARASTTWPTSTGAPRRWRTSSRPTSRQGARARSSALGYSNGANILASVIFRRPDLFGRAALLHPLIPWTPEPAPVTTRVLITAGERDPICPPEETRALEDWFRGPGRAGRRRLEPRRARDRPLGDRRAGGVPRASSDEGGRTWPIDPSDIDLEETARARGRYSYRVGDDEAEMTFSKAGARPRHHRPYRRARRFPRPGRRRGARRPRRRGRPGRGQEGSAALPVRGGAVPPPSRLGGRAVREAGS